VEEGKGSFGTMKSNEHFVYVDDPHPQSCASLVLLTKHLYRQDKDNPFGWIRFRNKFVKTRPRRCEYCGKTQLLSGRGRNRCSGQKLHDTITIDHAISLNNGGKRFDKKNLRISCYACNAKKGTMNEFSFRIYLLKETWKYRNYNGLSRFFRVAVMFLIALLSYGNNFGFIKKRY
jgi:5-methylcytosine-specific restriction endonuclease McrA